MKKYVAVVVTSLVVWALIFVGCSSQKAMWGNEKDGFVLMYRLAAGEQLSYATEGREKMTLEIMGSDQGPTTTFKNDYSVTAEDSDDDNLNLKVTIDNFVRDSQSPNGEFNVDASPILAKDFQLVLSPLGEELAYTGIEDLQIDLGESGGGIHDVLNYYRGVFPDLSAKPVKIGDSWIEEQEFGAPAGNMDVTIKAKTTHTLAGLETVDGEECLKISMQSESEIAGEGVQDGMDLDMTATSNATGIWYFAYKKGVLVKLESSTNLQGTIDVSGNFAFSMPIIQVTTATLSLQKK
jgi:hypothetical protein